MTAESSQLLMNMNFCEIMPLVPCAHSNVLSSTTPLATCDCPVISFPGNVLREKKMNKGCSSLTSNLSTAYNAWCKQDNNFFASVIKVRFHLMKQSHLTKVRSTQVSKWHLWANSTSLKSWPPNETLYVFKQNFIFHNPHSLCFSLFGYFRLWALWTRGAQKELLCTRSSSFLTFRVYNLIYPTVVYVSWST